MMPHATIKRVLAALAGAVALQSAIAAPAFQYRIPLKAGLVSYNPASGQIVSLEATASSVVAGSGTPVDVVARVQDSGSMPAPNGQAIQWSATGGSFIESTTATSGALSTGRYSPPTTAGTYTVTATLTSNSAARDVPVQVVANRDAAVVTAVSSEQNAIFVAGGATKLSAQVHDAFGNPLGAGVTVFWQTTAGTLSTMSSGTDATGTATTTLTAASEAGVSASITAKAASNDAGKVATVAVKAYATCAALLAARPGSPSGPYPLEVGGQVLQSYCDMATDGGGWTMVGNQVPTATGWANTTANINQAAFGNLNASWRYGDTAIQSIAHNTAWRITVDAGTLAFTERSYFSPSCVISWVDTYNKVGHSNSMPAACQLGFTSTALTTPISATVVDNASLGIGQNNNGMYCSARFASAPGESLNAAFSCNLSYSSPIRLWVK